MTLTKIQFRISALTTTVLTSVIFIGFGYEMETADLSTTLPRISCFAALDTTKCAAFIKESRMKFTNATDFNRKSGVA